MDPATVIALCKENIQPLRHGRNATQLGTALRAQEDTDAQQLLQQERQMYEDAIKNYEGDDPLENWYEYILWVEQSYPKSGHESHISRLLQQCLATFEKETKYHQDRRYIRLWINYISMQKNPLELYQLMYNHGIGTMVADMYRAWAFELEQNEDHKRADEVYSMGILAHAEPREELSYAQTNFQLAIARKMLGHRDERVEVPLAEQRQAFSSLRAIRAGKRVSNIRTGHRVRDHLPGTVTQVSNVSQDHRANARIQIYQDEFSDVESKSSSILDHVPIEESVHKENTLKPGPWSSASRRGPLISSAVRTSFKVHEDQLEEYYDMDKIRLFPNHRPFFDGSKYHDHLMVPVFVPDPPDPNIIRKVHYPKELVYLNNMDRSMEEIRAEKYLQRRTGMLEKECENPDTQLEGRDEIQEHVEQCELDRQKYEVEQRTLEQQRLLEQQRREAEQHSLERQRIEAEQRVHERQRLEAEQHEIERQRHEAELCELEKRMQESEQRELERRKAEQHELERQSRIAELEKRRREAEQRELERRQYEAEQRELERLEAERIEAERIEAERMEAERMEAELNRQRKMQSSNYMHQHHRPAVANDAVEHLLGQSLTVNTKEAMSVMQDLWQSPEANSPRSLVGNAMPHTIVEPRGKLSFDIHMDSSMTQHAMSSSKTHHQYSIQPYNDQENHQLYSTPFPSQEHQTAYGSHGYQSPYHYQMQQHHQQHIQPQQHHQQHIPSQQHHQQHVQPQQHHQQHAQAQQHHQQSPQPQQHHQPHGQPQQHHQQHIQPQHHHPPQHMQQHMYANLPSNSIEYQQYHSSMQSPPSHHNPDSQKQLQFTPYIDPDVDSNKPYKMPSELPYIKSPGMNRRDLKYLEGAENKENAIVVDYNGAVEEEIAKQPEENELYIDESLGIAPLAGAEETGFTQAFNTHLTSSTPMTNHFRQPHRTKEVQQFPEHSVLPQGVPDIRTSEGEEKLSVIMESTREYISSSSGSSAHTRTTGFTLTREDLLPIQEESSNQDAGSTEALLAANQTYEQKMRAQIQAVHAQSPRTVQRNVDEITSEIKNSCDLRKSISFKLSNEKDDSMECEEQEPMEEVEEEIFELPKGDINPFDKSLIAGLLKKIKFPKPYHVDGYVTLNTNLNKFVPSTMITLGTEAYDLEKCLGKGTYGTVFKGINLQTGQTVALKTQKPAWVWEYYIAREIKARLTNPHMLRGFMDITTAYVANNASTLVSEFSKYGTLLAVTNQVKIATGKPLADALAIFFTIEMLQIVEYLHKCKIIHGDIKPDNFLLMHLPTEDVRPTIQLIDFGCSIDMSLFPEETKFTQVIKTEDFTCIEMQTGKPWTYQTDLYCLAASSHCLLFGNYMRVSNTGGRWFINSKIPRYVKKDAWERYFTELLNIESCEKMPDLAALRNMLEETLAQVSELRNAIRSFSNILNKR